MPGEPWMKAGRGAAGLGGRALRRAVVSARRREDAATASRAVPAAERARALGLPLRCLVAQGRHEACGRA
ncbi:hypothetical protein AQI94_15930 [Streptomyces pseudovenezuelae]|uniref:Uncharacterized protein n=1 Tax=Streptomyces pseudovenezuelae TaxID=67350 RepID=A0A124HAD7_9ACTN|nr:hypothetical protein AQI94_15930 [Streptomyces pseudovenezuelae]